MGRPLKIQRNSTGSGNGGAAVGVDLGYPNFGSLTAPVYNSANTLNSTEFLGVVGGAAPTDNPSITFPRLEVIVNIANPSGTGLGVSTTGQIIRQKGSHKYLVADSGAVASNALVVGQAYQVVTLGTGDWSLVGAPGAAVGTIFTATATTNGQSNGTVNNVGVCVLADDTTPAAGQMAITYTIGDSTATTISKLTNKFLLNWTNFKNAAGTALTSYNSGGDNAGVVNYTGENGYVNNFFTDEGTVTRSGAVGSTSGNNSTGTVFNSSGLASLAILDNVTA